MAPAFSLMDQDGNKVSLKDFKGEKNVILYFYPKSYDSWLHESKHVALEILREN